MSTERGGDRRKRRSKYQNETAFRNDKYDNNTKAKQLNSMRVANVCQKCKHIIEWKIKYNKYKPLTTPKKCVKCSQKTVKFAYNVVCTSCVQKEHICAKCLQAKELIEEPEPDHAQRQREEAKLREGLKGMSLRERTTFLRQIERDRIAAESGATQSQASKQSNDDDSDVIDDDSDIDDDLDSDVCSDDIENDEIRYCE